MGFLNPGGHDLAMRANFDGLGQLYVAFITIWTVLLLTGMGCLIYHRNLPFLRIRNIPLAIAATSVLQVYFCLCFLAYVLNGYFHCDLEYWIMSVYLPLGIALFQVNNTQLQTVAGLQKGFVASEPIWLANRSSMQLRGWRRFTLKWKTYSPVKRVATVLGLAMILQLIVSLIFFFISRKFTSFGIVGHKVSPGSCRRGWEWLPSIFAQFVWAWIYAPYMLYKVRDIKDVHGWRLQTYLCVLPGLFGTPMWLAALYGKGMQHSDKYWVPPMWFTPGIAVMQASVIFVPCWQILRSRNLKKETLEIIAK